MGPTVQLLVYCEHKAKKMAEVENFSRRVLKNEDEVNIVFSKLKIVLVFILLSRSVIFFIFTTRVF